MKTEDIIVKESVDDTNTKAVSCDSSPLKKRKVDGNNNTLTPTVEAAKHPEAEEYWVCFPLPHIGNTLIDAYQYLNRFIPGFGQFRDNRTKLCHCDLFLFYTGVMTRCKNKGEAEELVIHVNEVPFLGKYKMEAVIISGDQVHRLCHTNVLSDILLEKWANNHLIQYVKYMTPAKYDSELRQLIYESNDEVKVHMHFMKNWLEEGKQDEKVREKNLISVPSEEALSVIRENEKIANLRLEYGLDRESRQENKSDESIPDSAFGHDISF